MQISFCVRELTVWYLGNVTLIDCTSPNPLFMNAIKFMKYLSIHLFIYHFSYFNIFGRCSCIFNCNSNKTTQYSSIPGACNNCLHTCPTGHWPLTGHKLTKSHLTGFLLLVMQELLCTVHCVMLAYNSMLPIRAEDCFQNVADQTLSLPCLLSSPAPLDDFTCATPHCAKGKHFQVGPDLFVTRG